MIETWCNSSPQNYLIIDLIFHLNNNNNNNNINHNPLSSSLIWIGLNPTHVGTEEKIKLLLC